MRRTSQGLWAGLWLLLFLWPAVAVFADGPVIRLNDRPNDGRIFVDEDVTLSPGEVFEGDLGVLRGDLDVPAGSFVRGDVFVTNGNVLINGHVDGDLAVLHGDLELGQSGQVRGDVFVIKGQQDHAGLVRGNLSTVFGDVRLRNTAIVEGSLLAFSGKIDREPGAQVRGEQISEMPKFPKLPIPLARKMAESLPSSELNATEVPQMPEARAPFPTEVRRFQGETFGQHVGRLFVRTFVAGFISLLWLAVGALVVVVWPRQVGRVAACVQALPLQSLGLGLVTLLIAAGLQALAMVLMLLIVLIGAVLLGTVILIPVGLLLILLSVLVLLPVPLALLGGMILGWVGLAETLGRRVLSLLHVEAVTPLGAVLAGLLFTVPIVALLWILKPVCCAWPLAILLGSVGLGAVVHTRLGRQGYPPSVSGDGVLSLKAMDEEAGRPDQPRAETG